MNFVELKKAADVAMREALSSAGFRRTAAGTWNRRSDDELIVIQLQKHSTEKRFCVNLGIHYTFLPLAGTQAPPLDGDQIEVPDCALKLRLTDQATVNDQWWSIDASSVAQVADLVCSRALPIFNSYRLDGPIAGMDGKSIENGNLGLLASMTKIGACLLLARMHEHLGNRDKSVEGQIKGVRMNYVNKAANFLDAFSSSEELRERDTQETEKVSEKSHQLILTPLLLRGSR